MTSATGFILQATRLPPQFRSLRRAIASVRRWEVEWKNGHPNYFRGSAQGSDRRALRRVAARWTDPGRARPQVCPGRDRIFQILYFLRRARDRDRDRPQK